VKKNNIFIFTQFDFINDKQGGGINTAMINIYNNLHKEFNFININIHYSIFKWVKLYYEKKPSKIYINGFFSIKYNLFPFIFFSFFSNVQLLIAPRGMLKKSALKKKNIIKKILLKIYTLNKRTILHVTDELERNETVKYFKNNKIIILPDLMPKQSNYIIRNKTINKLNILFVGRIDSIKNLLFVLETIKKVKCQFNFHINLRIAGNISDKNYFNDCLLLAEDIEDVNTEIFFLGELPRNELFSLYQNSHILFLPSLGENFGYAIAEALSHSLPVLISDKTFFSKYNNLVYSFSLNEYKSYINEIVRFSLFNNEDYNNITNNLFNSYKNTFISKTIIESYKNLFI
jgi:glycosyltransferase involved in cell wall biosynthesis